MQGQYDLLRRRRSSGDRLTVAPQLAGALLGLVVPFVAGEPGKLL